MTIHPKYINRRYPKREYVLVHKSGDFNGHLAGVRFENGQSEPVPMRKALRIAGPCGGKIRYGFCLEPFSVFGDASPMERAALVFPVEDVSEPEPDVPAEEADEAVEEAEFVFAEVPADTGPARYTRSFFESLTKAQIDEWAQEELGVSLNTTMKKADLIDTVAEHPDVEIVEE